VKPTTLTSVHLAARCKTHWRQLRLKNPDSIKAAIDQIFESTKSQGEALELVYKLVLPDWDCIRTLNGHPIAGSELWAFVCKKFMDHDRTCHAEYMPGGAWINSGFSCDRGLPPWDISFSGCTATLFPEQPNQKGETYHAKADHPGKSMEPGV
jgi:hypothetical protein